MISVTTTEEEISVKKVSVALTNYTERVLNHFPDVTSDFPSTGVCYLLVSSAAQLKGFRG